MSLPCELSLPLFRQVAIAAFAAVLSACTIAAPPTTTSVSTRQQSTASGVHLYVVDSLNGDIYRYPLVNGLPATNPDEVFATVGDAQFLGVDRAQNVYAAGSYEATGFVEKFSPNGTLLGSANFDTTIKAFTADGDGYLYVIPGNDVTKVYAYAPTAIGSGSVAEPIAILTGKYRNSGAYNAVPGLAIEGRGPLYEASIIWINVFDHPRTSSRQSSTIRLPRLAGAPFYDGAVALAKHHQLYANVGFGDTCEGSKGSCHGFWYVTDFEAISSKLGRPNGQMIRAHNCFFSGSGGARTAPTPLSGSYYYRSSGIVTGMAVYDGYVDAACTGDYSAVWVYRADDFTHQRPLEVLSGPMIPTDAKIGP